MFLTAASVWRRRGSWPSRSCATCRAGAAQSSTSASTAARPRRWTSPSRFRSTWSTGPPGWLQTGRSSTATTSMGGRSIRTRRRASRSRAALRSLLLLAAVGAAAAGGSLEADDARAPNSALNFGDEVSPLPLVSTSLLPGAELEIEAVLTEKPVRFEARADGGLLERRAEDRWRWRAPGAPGTYLLEVHEAVSDTRARLRVFVMRPYAGEETLDGYGIGAYPAGTAPPGLVRREPGLPGPP